MTAEGIAHIRMCKLVTKGQEFKACDIHGQAEMAPISDAEIVRRLSVDLEIRLNPCVFGKVNLRDADRRHRNT